jgi:hypothetical protein
MTGDSINGALQGRRDNDLDKRDSERVGLTGEEFAPDAVHADPVIALGDGRDQRVRLEPLMAEPPERERRVLPATPGESEAQGQWQLCGRCRFLRAPRRSAVRLDRLSAYEKPPRLRRKRPGGVAARTALPPRAGVRSARSGRPGSSPLTGHRSCGTAPDFAPDFAVSAPAGNICPALEAYATARWPHSAAGGAPRRRSIPAARRTPSTGIRRAADYQRLQPRGSIKPQSAARAAVSNRPPSVPLSSGCASGQ